MRPIKTSWVREARALTGISVAVSVTMFAQLSISAVETVIVARLGVRELAGVTLALGVYSLIFLFALGVVTAVTPIVASAYGRGDSEGLRLTGQQGFWVGLTFSIPGMLILLSCGSLLHVAIGSDVQADSAADYLSGAAWGLPAWVSYVAVRCLAVATGRVRITTLIMLMSVPIHAGLTWWLVFGGIGVPALGALGAGIAYTLTAFGALALLAALLCAWPAGAFGTVFHRPFVFDPTRFRAIVHLGVPFAFRIVLREGVLPIAAFLIAPFGATAVAAHAVATRVVDLTGVFAFGFSDAANMRVSHALGAAMPHRASRAGWIAIQLSTCVSALIAAGVMTEPSVLARWVFGDADPVGSAAAAATAAGRRLGGGAGRRAIRCGRRAQRAPRRPRTVADLDRRVMGGRLARRVAAGEADDGPGYRHVVRLDSRQLPDHVPLFASLPHQDGGRSGALAGSLTALQSPRATVRLTVRSDSRTGQSRTDRIHLPSRRRLTP